MRMMVVVAVVTCAWLVSAPSDAQTGKGLSQADVGKIKEVSQIHAKAALAKDWTMYVDTFLADGVMYPPNDLAVKSRAAIRAWAERFPPMTEFKASTVKVEGRDDLAYALGTYTITMAPPGAPGPVKDSGKFVEVLRRQPDGKWLIAVDMFNSDLPAVPPSR
jgi:ketosteroid isomerase-like protein